MQKQTRIDLLRWICVLPAAMFGEFAARQVSGLVWRFVIDGWAGGSESNLAFAAKLMVHAVAAAGFVLAGALTAPRSRGATALVLAIVSAFLSLVIHVLGQQHPGTVNYLHLAAEATGAALACACLFVGKWAAASR